jgi:outer membrane protein TolC
MQFEEALIEKSERNVENTKRLWMNNIYGSAGYNGGNQSIILNQTEAINESNNITNGYRWGVNVRLPLYELFGRKSQVKMIQAELEASNKQYEIRALEVQQLVIEAYFGLINSQELVRSRLRDYQTQSSNLELARIELLKGNIEMSQFAGFSNVATNSESAYLNAKQQFYTAFYLFETVVGVDINLLKR